VEKPPILIRLAQYLSLKAALRGTESSPMALGSPLVGHPFDYALTLLMEALTKYRFVDIYKGNTTQK
jgi:hypothetical protein